MILLTNEGTETCGCYIACPRVMSAAETGTKLLALEKPNSAASCTGHALDKGTHRKGVRDEIPPYTLLTNP